jgi:hypothetical protein
MRAARYAAIAAAAVVALTLTACGGSTKAAGATADNILVCQHYRIQRAHVKNLATPTLTDAIQFETWVALDAAQATPGTAVARDLAALSAAQHDTSGPQSAVYNTSTRVLTACQAIGVTFQS